MSRNMIGNIFIFPNNSTDMDIKESERERLRIWKYWCRIREADYPVEFKPGNTVDGKYYNIQSFCKFCTRTVYKDTEHVNPKKMNLPIYHDREIPKGLQGGHVTQHHTHCIGFWGTEEQKEKCKQARIEKKKDVTREGTTIYYEENPFWDSNKNAINEYREYKKPEQANLDKLFHGGELKPLKVTYPEGKVPLFIEETVNTPLMAGYEKKKDVEDFTELMKHDLKRIHDITKEYFK